MALSSSRCPSASSFEPRRISRDPVNFSSNFDLSAAGMPKIANNERRSVSMYGNAVAYGGWL